MVLFFDDLFTTHSIAGGTMPGPIGVIRRRQPGIGAIGPALCRNRDIYRLGMIVIGKYAFQQLVIK